MKLTEIFLWLQEENDKLRMNVAYLQGRVDERREIIVKEVEEVATHKESYAEKEKK